VPVVQCAENKPSDAKFTLDMLGKCLADGEAAVVSATNFVKSVEKTSTNQMRQPPGVDAWATEEWVSDVRAMLNVYSKLDKYTQTLLEKAGPLALESSAKANYAVQAKGVKDGLSQLKGESSWTSSLAKILAPVVACAQLSSSGSSFFTRAVLNKCIKDGQAAVSSASQYVQTAFSSSLKAKIQEPPLNTGEISNMRPGAFFTTVTTTRAYLDSSAFGDSLMSLKAPCSSSGSLPVWIVLIVLAVLFCCLLNGAFCCCCYECLKKKKMKRGTEKVESESEEEAE